MSSNVTTIKTKVPAAKTIESAKSVQRLVGHLEAVRKHRNYLAQCKTAKATTINFTAPLPEHVIPDEALRQKPLHGGHFGYGEYRYRPDSGWTRDTHIADGKFPKYDTVDDRGNRGHIGTLGWRVMDAVRAAVNQEVEETEQAIRDLGYEVPADDGV